MTSAATVPPAAERRTARPEEARGRFRQGLRTPTAGWCDGHAQANLLVVPREAAYDALLFGQRNPKPCPVLDVTEPGDPHPRGVAPSADLRTDLPAYRVFRNGELVDETTDVSALWRDDLVGFLLGCSFTFEQALLDAGVPVRHRERDTNVAMYRTTVPCRPAGRLRGPLVVSMRPIPAALVDLAFRVTARYPRMHGAPVHAGDPAHLGIADLDRPDYGDPPEIRSGEVPTFWACGVTPQAIVMASRVPFAITHAPGHMFITDRRHDDFAAE